MEWDIYNQSNECVATWKSKEVRLALIHGQIDPFTIIAPAGNLEQRSTVIETEAIFETVLSIAETAAPRFENRKRVYPKVDSLPGLVPDGFGFDANSDSQTPKGFGFNTAAPKSQAGSTGTGSKSSGLALANPDVIRKLKKTQKLRKERRKRLRGNFPESGERSQARGRSRYYIHAGLFNKKGPFRAKDIAKSFYKGQLAASTMVSIRGQSKKLPIKAFIKAFAPASKASSFAARGGTAVQKQGFAANAPTRVDKRHSKTNISQHAARHNSDMILYGVLGLVLAIMLGLVAFKLFVPAPPSPRSQPTASPQKTRPLAPSTTAKVPEKVTSKAISERTRARARAIAPPSRRQAPNTSRVRVEASPYSIASVKATGKGRVVRIGPVTFSEARVRACGAKCNLTVRDAKGDRLVVVFFKQAFLTNLTSTSGRAFLSGRLDESGTTLFLQEVSASR